MRAIYVAIALLILASALLAAHFAAEPAPPADPEVAALIRDLGSDDYVTREKATERLESLGDRALPQLRQAAEQREQPEVRWRAHMLVAAPHRTSRSSGIELVLIKEGEFTMGSPEGEVGRYPEELAHKVRITKAFYLSQYEITQKQYAAVVKSNPSGFAATGDGKGRVAGIDTTDFPVERVSWFDAARFCNELSKADSFEPYYQLEDMQEEEGSIKSAKVTVRGGHGYRLPTEAEWEYACRAGTSRPYHYGDGTNGRLANVKGIPMGGGYGGPVKGPDLGRTAKVGSYPANAWGLFDMHGNVAEWCQDWHGKDYYAQSPRNDPTGPASGVHRVVRGGSWLVPETSARAASRAWQTPDERKEHTGFRIARCP